MRKLFVIGWVFLIAAALSAAPPDPSLINTLWQQASVAQQQKQFAKAASIYRQILAIQPDLTEAEVNLGLMYQLTGDRRAAIASFQHVLKKSPELYAPNFLTGLDYLKLGNPELALPYLQRATAANPNENKARAGLANAYLQLGRYSEAEKEFNRAIELDNKNADAWYGLGVTYLSLEHQAEQTLRESSPTIRPVLLAEAYLQQGRPASAIKLLQPIAGSTPHLACVNSLLGFAYLRNNDPSHAALQFKADDCLLSKLGAVVVQVTQGNIDAALNELREALAIDRAFVQTNNDFFSNDFTKAGAAPRLRALLEQDSPTKGDYTVCSATLANANRTLTAAEANRLSFCSFYIGRDDLVLKATAQARAGEGLYWRVKSLERLGVASVTKATSINPDSVSLHVLLASMSLGKSNFVEAASEYRSAIALQPEFIEAHMGLARTLYWDNKQDEAEPELQYVLAHTANDPEASYLMAEILIKRRDFAHALPLLQAGLHAAPEELPHVHAALSKVYENKGDLVRATSELQQALPADVDGSYHYRLGHLYLRAGNRAAAVEALKQSATLQQRENESVTLPGT